MSSSNEALNRLQADPNRRIDSGTNSRVVVDSETYKPKTARMPDLTPAQMVPGSAEKTALLNALAITFAYEVEQQFFLQQGDESRFYKVTGRDGNGNEVREPYTFREMARIEGSEQGDMVAVARLLLPFQRQLMDVRNMSTKLNNEKKVLAELQRDQAKRIKELEEAKRAKAAPRNIKEEAELLKAEMETQRVKTAEILQIELQLANLRAMYSSMELQISQIRALYPKLGAAMYRLLNIRSAIEREVAPQRTFEGKYLDSTSVFYEGLQKLMALNP